MPVLLRRERRKSESGREDAVKERLGRRGGKGNPGQDAIYERIHFLKER